MRQAVRPARLFFLLAFCPLAALGPLAAQPAAAQAVPACAAILAGPSPQPPHFASALPAAELAHCDEQALYYGFGHPPNYPAALECGWYQRAHPEPSVADQAYGPGVLAMLYANGFGVARDYGLAARFACEDAWIQDGAQADRIAGLRALAGGAKPAAQPRGGTSGKAVGETPGQPPGGSQTKPFDLCDEHTSGVMAGLCAQTDQRRRDARRAATLASLKAHLPAPAQAALPQLQQAEHTFEKARAANEIDRSGTAQAAFVLEEQGKLRDQFVINLEHFASGKLPATSFEDRLHAGRELGLAYDTTQKAPASAWAFTTVRPAGIALTERNWQQLFAAWLHFLPLAYPGLEVDSAATELLRLRIDQLRALVPNA